VFWSRGVSADGALVLQESEDEQAIREARAMEKAGLEILLHGSSDVKELTYICGAA
jgi:hypothetical protein